VSITFVFHVVSGEKIGVEYLFSQTGKILQDLLSDPENESLAQFDQDRETADRDSDSEGDDEGFEDEEINVGDPTQPPVDADQFRRQEPSAAGRPTTPTHDSDPTPTGNQQLERTDASVSRPKIVVLRRRCTLFHAFE
jgi:hypothetical protein